MTPFYTLREFMLLTDPTDQYERSIHRVIRGPVEMIEYYETAKASYEKYGSKGIPFGSKVVTLVPGHGGHEGARRTLKGIFDRDPRFLILTRLEPHNRFYGEGGMDERESLVLRAHWWSEIRAWDDSWLIMSGRRRYWDGDHWVTSWLSAQRFERKTDAAEVVKTIKTGAPRAAHAEDW